jgi:hypothetical protein
VNFGSSVFAKLSDITSKLGTNNNLSQYLYNPKSDIPMLDIAPSEKVGITGIAVCG